MSANWRGKCRGERVEERKVPGAELSNIFNLLSLDFAAANSSARIIASAEGSTAW